MLTRAWYGFWNLVGGLLVVPFLFVFGTLFAIPDVLRYRRIATM